MKFKEEKSFIDGKGHIFPGKKNSMTISSDGEIRQKRKRCDETVYCLLALN